MKPTALVLSGGGAGGAFQIGVLKKIWFDEVHNVGAIYGTSVGALNAAALRHVGFFELESIWNGIKKRSDILKLNPLHFVGLARGKYSTDPLEAIIDRIVSRKPIQPQISVNVSAVNYETGELRYCNDTEWDFKQMVLASASVPFHMEPVGPWVDGGVRDHTPIQRAIDDGYERIIAICCNPWSRRMNEPTFKASWPLNVSIGLRCTDILQSEVMYGDLNPNRIREGIEIIRYAPQKRIIDTFEYDPVKIKLAIEQGYRTDASF